jgi:hypothetical protein
MAEREADMVSAKLVHLLEDHWEAVLARTLRLIRNSKELPHLSRMPESEVSKTCKRVVHNLGHWLASAPEEELGDNYEKLGRERCKEGMPLSEAIRGVQFMKEASVGYIRDQGFFNTVDVYAEEELEHELGRFFDLLVFHLARGYELEHADRDRRAARAAAAAN